MQNSDNLSPLLACFVSDAYDLFTYFQFICMFLVVYINCKREIDLEEKNRLSGLLDLVWIQKQNSHIHYLFWGLYETTIWDFVQEDFKVLDLLFQFQNQDSDRTMLYVAWTEKWREARKLTLK